MSEVATAPVAIEGAPAAAETVAEQAKPTNAREARQMGRQRAQDVMTGTVAEQANTRHEQPRDDAGRFASTDAAADAAAPEPPVEPAPATPEAAPEQPRFVRIELPEGHPLRLQGRTHVTVDANDDQAVRALLNNPVRRQEVETERRARLQAEAEAKAWREATEAFFSSPEDAAYYLELKQINPQVAETFKRGKLAEYVDKVQQSAAEVEQQIAQERSEAEGRQFVSGAWQLAASRYPQWYTQTPEFQTAFQTAVLSYGTALSAGLIQEYSVEDFISRQLDPAYFANPHVRQYLTGQLEQRNAQTAQQIAAKAQKEAEERQRQELAALADRSRTNPQGRIPSQVVTGQQAMPVSGLPRTAKEARQRARDRYNGHA